MITANSRITHESSNQCQGLVSVIPDLELGCRCAGVVVSNGLEVGGSFAQRRREWRGESEGCKPLLREQTLQLKRGGGGILALTSGVGKKGEGVSERALLRLLGHTR